MGSEIVHAARDDAQRPGPELGRPRAERAVPRHILHLAMPALSQPFEQPRLRGREIGVGDAHRVEAELATPSADARGERAVVHALRS